MRAIQATPMQRWEDRTGIDPRNRWNMRGERYLHQWEQRWIEHHDAPMVLALHPDSGDLHRWDGGVWRNLTPTWPQVIAREGGESLTKYQTEDALQRATSTLPMIGRDGTGTLQRHELGSTEPRINFQNGVLDLTTGELMPHGEPWNTVNQIPWEYDADITDRELYDETAALDAFLDAQLEPDTARASVIWQLFGASMLPGNPEQRLHIFTGPGGSGKGTVLHILEDLVGPENRSQLSPSQLRGRFAAADLHGKLVNIAGDVAGGTVGAYEVILGITGGDTREADRKFREPIKVQFDGQLLLATNGRLTLPPGAGIDSGWWRRADYIALPRAVPASERRSTQELRRELTPNMNLTATRAARELIAELKRPGPTPAVTESMATAKAVARVESNTALGWAYDRLQHADGAMLTGSEAYQDYRRWCEHYGRKARSGSNFYEDLDSVLPMLGTGGRAPDGTTASTVAFTGVALRMDSAWIPKLNDGEA